MTNKGTKSTLHFHRIMEGLCIVAIFMAIIMIIGFMVWQHNSNSAKPFSVEKFSALDICVAEKVKDQVANDQLVTNGMVEKFQIICNELENSKSQIEKDKEATALQKKAIGQLKQH